MTLVNSVHVNSKTLYNVTRILMSPANYALIRAQVFSASSDLTTLEYFKRNNPGVDVIPVQEMSGGAAKGGMGGTATDAVFAYSPDISCIRLAIPMAIEQRPPTEKNLKIETIYRSKTGGFIIRKPLSMGFLIQT